MRLTLRTLIAWLDDTLTPGEVREIGLQVAESPFAKELVERVHRVTRQRRLTVPPEDGPEASDPNHVAGYLDNQLAPEQVAEFEKRCLTSDVHLAEVASVHQILSLIGHKAKVPGDAKSRMYRLVQGREASNEAQSARPAQPAANPAAKPAARPISAWAEVAPTRRPWIERFGPTAAVLFLIGLLGWTAAYSLRPESGATPPITNRAREKANADEAAAKKAAFEAHVAVATPEPPPVAPIVQPPRPETLPAPDDEMASIAAVQGIMLRYSAEKSSWDRIDGKVGFKGKTRLINLAPFRNTISLNGPEVDLVESTGLVIDSAEKGHVAPMELLRGQIVLASASPPVTYPIRFEGQVMSVTPPQGGEVGIERLPYLQPGQAEPSPLRLRIYVPQGTALLKVGQVEEKLNGPGEISLMATGQFTERGRQPVPGWVAATTPSPYSKEVATQFTSYFRSGRPILSDLVEAMDDTQKDVKRLAVFALGTIGDTESVVAGLDRKDDPAVHQAVVQVLRDGLAAGGESARSIRSALVRQYDEIWAAVTERMLAGFDPKDARDEAVLAKLVEYLDTAPSRGTRELALDNLRSLTGRDSLEYDPDSPEGKGLKAWQDLVRKKELTKDSRPGTILNPR